MSVEAHSGMGGGRRASDGHGVDIDPSESKELNERTSLLGREDNLRYRTGAPSTNSSSATSRNRFVRVLFWTPPAVILAMALSSLTSTFLPIFQPTPIHAPHLSDSFRQYILSADLANQALFTPEVTAPMLDLIEKFTPVIKLHSEEDFFPSDIDYMLGHYSRALTRDGAEVDLGSLRGAVNFPVNRTTLSRLPQSGKGLWLDLLEPHNAQPGFPTVLSNYLYGPGGQSWAERAERKGRDRVTRERKVLKEKMYAFYADKGNGMVDLFYWTFYPYNLGKTIPFLGILGNHLGDWEHIRVRTINGTGASVDFSVHANLRTGTWRWEDVEKYDGRPVAYSAKGSHGLWPNPGPHIYIEALKGLFKLIDYTDDEGVIWDPLGQVEAIPWKEVRENLWRWPRYDPSGEFAWLNYGGRWGDKGDRDCWFYKVSKTCQMADSPTGPNRYFSDPPMCGIHKLNPPNTKYSKVNFNLDQSALVYAWNNNLTKVMAEAVCSTTTGWQEAPQIEEKEKKKQVDIDIPPTPEGDFLTLSRNLAELNRTAKSAFEVEVEACPTAGRFRSYLTGYRLSLCNGTSPATTTCYAQSHIRDICTFLPNTTRYTSGQSADIDDPDPWWWNYEPEKPVAVQVSQWSILSMVYLWFSTYLRVFW